MDEHPALALGQGRLPLGGRDGGQGRPAGVRSLGARARRARSIATRPAGPATVHRRGPGAVRRAEHPPAGGRTAGRRRRPGPRATPWSTASARRWPGRAGASGRSEVAAARRSSAWWACTGSAPRCRSRRRVEIGWRLHPDHWGHGYATEAAAASLWLRLRQAGLAEIVAFTATVNTRSQAVMERIGMRARPRRRTSTTRACPRTARCAATCSTGSVASHPLVRHGGPSRERQSDAAAVRVGRQEPRR